MASSVVLRESLSEMGSSPRASRWALATMRRYLATLTPGTAIGYWKAMIRPARARSSGSASVTSSPLKVIDPSVTSRFGWPMIALASVDLPEPLGPIRAWTSPERTDRSSPLRICLSPAATWRFLISSSGMKEVSRGGSLVGERDEVGERRLLQRLEDAALDARPEQLGRAAVAAVGLVGAQHAVPGVAIVDEAGHRGDRALQGQDRLVH